MSDHNIICVECGCPALHDIRTYKRIWHICSECGTAFPRQRDRYPLSFLPVPEFKRQPQDEQSIYDYFVQPANIALSASLVQGFIDRYVAPQGISFAGQRVLDVSGGNGHFAKGIEALGASVVLTEINRLAIEYARRTHGFDVHEFNFNRNRLTDIVDGNFDIVMLRAAIMFCHDLSQLAGDLAVVTKPSGLVIINHSVIPTLGVMLRVQLDEYSYYALRQPEIVIRHFEKNGFSLVSRNDEIDPTLYICDYDLKDSWLLARALYEIPAARKMRTLRQFDFPARDRRRSTMIFRKI